MSNAVKEIKLLGKKVIVKVISEDVEKGIIITQGTKEIPERAYVVNAGSSVKELKTGDIVVFEKGIGSRIVIDDEDYLIVSESSIYGTTERIITKKGDIKDVNMNPLGSKIFISWEYATKEYGNSGLIRPESYNQMHYTGNIVAMGKDVDEDLSVDDRIFFDRFCGPLKYVIGNDRYAFVHESDVLAVIPERLAERVA